MAAFELVLRAEFSAAHRLRMPETGYEPLHSHTWRVEAYVVSSNLDAFGLVADFTILQEDLGRILRDLEDTCLNDLPAFSTCNPSAELVAKHLHDRYKDTLPPGLRLVKIRVWETSNCAASYIPSDIQTEGVD